MRRTAVAVAGAVLVAGLGVVPPGTASASLTAAVQLTPAGGQAPVSVVLTPLDEEDAQAHRTSATDEVIDLADLRPGRYRLTMAMLAPDVDSAGISCQPMEAVQPGSGDPGSAIVSLEPGQQVACTLATVRRGEIVLAHRTTPRGKAPLRVTPSWDDGFRLTGGQRHGSGGLVPAQYSLTAEAAKGWDLTSARCDDGSTLERIGLDPGETVTCTLESTQRGRIAITSRTRPAGSEQAFTVRRSWAGALRLSDEETSTSRALPPGRYQVAVDGPPGWDVGVARCSDGSKARAIRLDPGETVRCTVSGVQRGRVVVAVQTGTSSGLELEVEPSWGRAFTVPDGESVTSRDLRPGTYRLAVETPSGWVRTSDGCDDGSSLDEVTVGAGETVTCTIVLGQPTFTVASFNVLGHSHTEPGGHSPGMASGPTRMGWTVGLLRSWGVDVVGLQEFQPPQMDAFVRLAGEYQVYPGPGLDQRNKQNAVAWRSDVFELVEGRPVMIPYFHGNLVPMPLVRLRHKATGLEVYVMSVHNAASTRRTGNQDRWRDAAMRQQIGLTDQLLAQGIPFLMTGDMNERERYFCAYTASGRMYAAAGGSNNGACAPPPASIARIDWIFGSRDIEFADYRFVKDGSVTRVSDHPLVLAEATLQE